MELSHNDNDNMFDDIIMTISIGWGVTISARSASDETIAGVLLQLLCASVPRLGAVLKRMEIEMNSLKDENAFLWSFSVLVNSLLTL